MTPTNTPDSAANAASDGGASGPGPAADASDGAPAPLSLIHI